MPCSHCGRDVRIHAKGLCGACYKRLKTTGSLEKRIPDKEKQCSVYGCTKLIHAKGVCANHYARLLKYGDTKRRKVKKDIICGGCGETKPHKARGLCDACYARLSRRGTTKYKVFEKDKPCTFCGENPIKANGLCQSCYQRYKKKGSAEYDPVRMSKKAHPLWSTWRWMHMRCNDEKHPSYALYGGRGVSVCERWSDFWNFVEDMGDKPTPQHTIDRVDGNGNYEKKNCRWATSAEQAQNRVDNVIDGETAVAIRVFSRIMTNTEIAHKLGINPNIVYQVKNGITWSKAE